MTLHAGELAPGLVPTEDLRFHIRDAVQRARLQYQLEIDFATFESRY